MMNLLDAIIMLFRPESELRQIVGVTLKMAAASTSISFVIGITLGVIIGITDFRGKKLIMNVTSSLMGLPPVLAGLIVFGILSRSGPLGEFKLLYSVTAMVCAQILIITPITINMSATFVDQRIAQVRETMLGMGFPKIKQMYYMLYETKTQLFAIFFLGFGRAISEVGAAQLVGGNIQFKTRVMTTAIVLETNKGDFQMALAIGFVLLIIAFTINTLAHLLQRDRK
jgi:tungstate transport system permease protein